MAPYLDPSTTNTQGKVPSLLDFIIIYLAKQVAFNRIS